MKKQPRTSLSELNDVIPLRCLTLYCVLIVNPDTGNMRCLTTIDMDKCLELSLEFRKSDLYIDTFTRKLIMTPSHKLYSLGVPFVSTTFK